VSALVGGALSFQQLLRPIPILSLVVATLAAAYVFRFVGCKVWLTRIAVAVTSAAVLGGYWVAQYPVAIAFDTHGMTWQGALAPSATLNALSLALVVGLLLIGPGLVVLYRVFK